MSRLVLADDSTTIQKIVELSFAAEDIEVDTFVDGNEALVAVRNHGADVVLADISLPGLDGYELCRALAGAQVQDPLPVVLLAGTFEPFDVQKAEEVGYSGSLTKPFETTQLVSLVRSLLRGEEEADLESGEGEGLFEPLFDIPILADQGSILFRLSSSQCRPGFATLQRAASPVGSVGPEGGVSGEAKELEAVIEKVIDRLPDQLRKILPEIARDVLKEKE